MAAFSMSLVAALMASDASFATGADAATPSSIPVYVSTPESAPSALKPSDISISQTRDGSVVFAPAREVVQDTSTMAPKAATTASSLTDLVQSHSLPETLDAETRCLASAVFYEARGETLKGQLAVARVIINRRDSGRFATSLCGVVTQRGQFSFVRGGVIPTPSVSSNDWREAVAIAQIALNDTWESQVEGALFFHARHVSPRWNKTRLASVDNHVFYR